MEWIEIIEKWFWFGFGALGFAILFNVPSRTLFPIWILGVLGGITKLLCLKYGVSIVLASLWGATVIGIASIVAAHNKHAPPLVFSIPAIIPLVPGIFAYRMMLGLMNLTGNLDLETYHKLTMETVNNGLKAIFILMCLAVGVSIPMLLTRKSSVKEITFGFKKRDK